MNAMLLQCCGCAEKIVKLVSSMENATNCRDVEIAKAVCCAIVSITAIVVFGFLLWRLMDYLYKGCQEEKKQKYEVAEKKRRQKANLQDKLLGFLEKNTTQENYNAEIDKFVKTLREIDSEESQYYVKTILALISDKAIPDYSQKPKVVEKKDYQ